MAAQYYDSKRVWSLSCLSFLNEDIKPFLSADLTPVPTSAGEAGVDQHDRTAITFRLKDQIVQSSQSSQVSPGKCELQACCRQRRVCPGERAGI